MKVVALQTWSNGTITMEEKSVQDITDALAEQLIADGICADAAEYFGGGSGGGDVIMLKTRNGVVTCDKSLEEIYAIYNSGNFDSIRVCMIDDNGGITGNSWYSSWIRWTHDDDNGKAGFRTIFVQNNLYNPNQLTVTTVDFRLNGTITATPKSYTLTPDE